MTVVIFSMHKNAVMNFRNYSVSKVTLKGIVYILCGNDFVKPGRDACYISQSTLSDMAMHTKQV